MYMLALSNMSPKRVFMYWRLYALADTESIICFEMSFKYLNTQT